MKNTHFFVLNLLFNTFLINSQISLCQAEAPSGAGLSNLKDAPISAKVADLMPKKQVDDSQSNGAKTELSKTEAPANAEPSSPALKSLDNPPVDATKPSEPAVSASTEDKKSSPELTTSTSADKKAVETPKEALGLDATKGADSAKGKDEEKGAAKDKDKIDSREAFSREALKSLELASGATLKPDEGILGEMGTPSRAYTSLPSGKPDDLETITESIFKKHSTGHKDPLDSALKSTYDMSPEIKEKRAALRAQDEAIVQAKAGWRPTITGNISGGLSRQNNMGDQAEVSIKDGNTFTNKVRDTNLTASVQLNQNLYNGGNTVYQTREAEAKVRSARAQLADAEQNALFSGVDVYLQLLHKYAQLELLRRNEDNLKQTLAATRDKFDVGEETRTSVAQAEGQYADSVAQRQTAEAELEGLKAAYRRVTNREPGDLSKPNLPFDVPDKLDIVLERVRLNFPLIIQAQFDEKAARHAIDKLETGLLPKLDLVASSTATKDITKNKFILPRSPQYNQELQTNRSTNHSAKLQLSIPLYEAGATRSQVRQQAELAEQSRIGIERIRRQAMSEATQAWNNFIAARANIEYYKKQVQANMIALDGTQQELLVGSKILLDVLNAIGRLVDSQQKLVQAEQQYYQNAYRVMFFMGEMTAKGMGLRVGLYDPKNHYKETRNRF